MNRKIVTFPIIALCLLVSCTPAHHLRKSYSLLSKDEKVLADSIISYGLNHEALYTLADTLKPISSLQFYRLPVFSNNLSERDSAIEGLRLIQQIAIKLSFKDYLFVLNPFEKVDSIYKNIEIYAINVRRLQSIVKQHHPFYSRFGITEHTPAATILAITEYENKYDRWRSYGYLFGYPDYAVDFFVEAGRMQDSTKEFVKRDFFQVPVHAANSGYFTYAIPKGHLTGQQDSVIYFKAMTTLNKYRTEKGKRFNTAKPNPLKLWVRLQKNK